jgi:spore coat polysaccharide biosynthesis protein SpsF (cytidylyltransferase family)
MICCIIQARTGSKRLPKKVIQKIDNNLTILDYVINQVKYSKKIEKIVIATTDLMEDDVICQHLDLRKIKYFRGSSEDVLDRFYQCAKKESAENIVRITADNPLIDPNIIDKTIEVYENKEFDLVTNTINRTFPYGTEVEVFSFDSLEKSWNNAKKPSEREHVTPFIRNPENKFLLTNIKNEEDFSFLRYTIDRTEDLKLVKEIIKNISTRPILLKDIITLYKNNSKIFDINKNIKHDGYLSSIEKDEQYFKSKNNERT